MTAKASLTIIFRPKVKGGDEGYWYLYIRKPRPEKDETIPVKGLTKRSDRPAVEAFAAPYRKALKKGLAERPETAGKWFGRYVDLHEKLGHGTAQHVGDWDRYVAPFLGNKGMAEITQDDIKAIRDSLTSLRLAGKISAHRAMNVWSTVLTAPFRRAWTDDDPKYKSVRVGPYAANPAIGVKPPVTKDDQHEDERERQPLEAEEARALLSCADVPVEDRRFYAWAMLTGLRPAEIYGLDWADVRADVIKVQRGRDMKSGDDGDTKNRQ